jgi:hypothetical protein
VVRADRDENGTHWIISQADVVRTPGGKTLGGATELQVWWDRDTKNKADETLIIRQDNGAAHADIIIITLGQAYDLIDALNKAVENA